MFTIDQVHEAFDQVRSGKDFPKLVQDLKSMGITKYDNFAADGRTKYYGKNNFVLDGGPKYPSFIVNSKSSAEKLKHAISIHQQRQTDYPTFCEQATEAGVEKWTTDMIEMTVTYFGKQGRKLVVETIPEPS